MAFEADETMAAQALVAAGVGITIYPRLALSPIHPGVVSRAAGQERAHPPDLGGAAAGRLPLTGVER